MEENIKHILLGSLLLGIIQITSGDLTVSTNVLDLAVKTCDNVTFILSDAVEHNITIILESQHTDIANATSYIYELKPSNISQSLNVTFCANNPGHSTVVASIIPSNFTNYKSAFVQISVYNYHILEVFSFFCGWIYFFSWSVSFYPQAIINYKRKSVIGLNFDFLTLNIVGYLLYSAFNIGLYYVPAIQDQYFSRYPRGLNPVQLNDVGFSVHAFLVSVFTIVQCFIYERGDQAVSKIAMTIISAYCLILLASGYLVFLEKILTLDFLYICSYIKLCITLIKYIPQALMNYRRRSTIGWSIGNVICDFIGGVLSILQMLIISYNYDDWASIFGDLTKFGLGMFSVAFDIIFLLQHFVFFRDSQYEELTSDNETGNDTSQIEQPEECVSSSYQETDNT